jgi:cyclophilin family peptidyl-prolyl cis-trans isomerase/HEAT repeat protein
MLNARRSAAPLSARNPRRTLGWALTLGLALSACQSAADRQAAEAERLRAAQDLPQGTPVALPTRSDFAEIAGLEENREGAGRLIEFLQAGDPPLAARAALALSRLPLEAPGDRITQALCQALDHPDRGVRRRAAWALGQRGDTTAAGVLARHWSEPDAAVRARVVEAGARVGETSLTADLLRALGDPDQGVRLEAIAGLARWDRTSREAARIDRALIEALSPVSGRGEAARSNEEIWMTLYALARRRSDRGRAGFLEYIADAEPTARLFAAQGLARLEPDWDAGAPSESSLALLTATQDADWRVVCEALEALGKRPTPEALESLERCARHPSAHVRGLANSALGNLTPGNSEVRTLLRRGLTDRSPSVRVAALEGLCKQGPEAVALEAVEDLFREQDAVQRAGVARALRHLPAQAAAAVLDECLRDVRPFVAIAAIETLGELPSEANLARLRRELDGQFDNGRRLAAILALRPHSSERDLPHLSEALQSSAGEVAAEVAWNALLNVRQIGGEGARPILEQALRYPHPRVTEVAREAFRALYPDLAVPELSAAPGAPRSIPLPGIDYPRWTRNPLVRVETNRGELVFELFPAEAPLHVYSFIELAKRGHFEDLGLHRVVPNFVVQGGDPRGDGNGGSDWRGLPLRSEFSERKFLRGSLGMPRNEDPDSGGCQIFVTHRPTPHLDGNYTLFGQLLRGFEVLDLLEVGDRILEVELLPAAENGQSR